MKIKRHMLKSTFAVLLVIIMIMQYFTHASVGFAQSPVGTEQNPLMIVNMTEKTGDILHGASGFLYGISSEDVPTTNTLVPLKPKILATKGALGTEHPYGDALDVAKTFLEAGGEQVQMYNSNYYAIFGPDPSAGEYAEALEEIIAPKVVEWKEEWKRDHANDHLADIDIDQAIVYIPINEGTPAWLETNQRDYDIYESWKMYYEAIKRADPNATIGGLNDYDFNVSGYKEFLKFAKENNVLPDIFTWHELDTADLKDMSSHIQQYRQWEDEVGIEEIPVVINEYATMQDPGIPGKLVNWISRLEDAKLYGALPFWHQANNLNDLAADANEPNGAWWLYKWYGDMSGQTLKVETQNTSYYKFYGLASIDDQKFSSTVLFGGVDGDSVVALKDINKTEAFKDAEKVHIKIRETQFTGYHGVSKEPPVIKEGTYPVINGNVIVEMENMLETSAYNITVTQADEDDMVQSPFVGKYSAWYEAEDARLIGGARRIPLGGIYHASGNEGVGFIDNDGDGLEYTVNVPTDGRYKLDFIYGNGVGTDPTNEENHNPINLTQTLTIDGNETLEMEMRNTLLHDMTGTHTEYVDLTAGEHTLTIMKSGVRGGVVHDALSVSYAGAYGEENHLFNKKYEAEQADFNTLADTTTTKVKTKTSIKDYTGNGYVTGLNQIPVTDGGGIRWNIIVENSGLYNVSLRYQSKDSGKANIYVGNTARTLDELVASADVENTKDQWQTTSATVYLQKGINIVDVDADTDIALDYIRVNELNDTEEIKNLTKVVAAEDAIPEGSNIETRTTTQPEGTTYVVGMKGDKDAANDKNKYLEFNVNVPTSGLYNMQVFFSVSGIFGTHAYNTKIIDKYASFQINDGEPERHFFINTFSADTFKEKTIPVQLEAGDNTIKVFNDDSWQVLKGIANYYKDGDPNWYQDKPGDIPLENYAPNFDKFVFTPAALDEPIEQDISYNVNVKSTKGGNAVPNKNNVSEDDSVSIKIIPDSDIENIQVNNESLTEQIEDNGDGTYKLTINNVQSDLEVEVQFTQTTDKDNENTKDYIRNNSFGTGNLEHWNVESDNGIVKIDDNPINRYHGDHYLKFSNDKDQKWSFTLSQQLEDMDNGSYLLSVYTKNLDTLSNDKEIGDAEDFYLYADNGKVKSKQEIIPTKEYTETLIPVEIVNGTLDIGVHANGNANFSVYIDYFTLEFLEVDPDLIDESIAYFVNAGAIDPEVLNDGDKFGKYNSVTDKFYGVDHYTGKKWGVVDKYIDAGNNLLTGEWTWPAENINATEDSPKEYSYRYAREQDVEWPNDLEARPGVQYKFELPNSEYEVEVGMLNQWGNFWNADLYFNRGKDTEKKVLSSTPIPTGSLDNTLVIKDKVIVTDGELTVHARMADQNSATTMISYIIVKFTVDKTDLSNVISKYNDLLDHAEIGDGPGQYPESAVDAFETTLNAAQAVLEDPSATQNEVDLALESLEDARKVFEESKNQVIVINKEELKSVLETAQSLLDNVEIGEEPGQYPQSAVDAFISAIEIAQSVFENDSATQDEVDGAVEDLEDAHKVFEESINKEEVVNKKKLESALETAQRLIDNAEVGKEPGQYPQSAIDAFKSAIASAQTVLGDTSATQAEVDSTVENLENARKLFEESINKEEVVNKKKLESALETAQRLIDNAEVGKEPGKYSQSAVDAFKSVIASAQTVLGSTSATQEEVDSAVENLENARKVFEESINKEEVVNKKKLESALETAQRLIDNAEAGKEPGQYPQSAIDKFKSVLASVQTIFEDTTSTQEEVDKALTRLEKARTVFEKSMIPVEIDSVDDSDDKHSDDQGDSLPKTATSTYNWILAGSIFLIIGGIALSILRKRNQFK